MMRVADGLASLFRGLSSALDSRDEREFLPAALEIIETPPSPVSRVFALLIGLFFVSAVAWAFVGKVDVISTAAGRILPAGEVKVIQSLNPGLVTAIHVADGDVVRTGQVLIELDPTQTGADKDRLAAELMQARLDLARLTALKSGMAGAGLKFVAPPGATPEQAADAEAAMRAQASEQASKLADFTHQIAQKAAEAAEIVAESDRVNATLPFLRKKEQAHRALVDRGYGATLAYLDAQQQLSSAEHELEIQARRKDEVLATRAALEQAREGTRQQYADNVLSKLGEAQVEQNRYSQDLIKAEAMAAQTQLRSPIDGVVERLAVHTLQGVVTPAEQLMIIVPQSRNVVVEAQLSNRDVGFVHPGQAVRVKIETFDFTRYGLLDGHVVGVSRDAIAPRARPATGAGDGEASEPSVTSPPYVARIVLSTTSMLVDGRMQPLQAGMAVTAEIKTGERTIMDYLLSPLARKTAESLHER